MARYLSNDATQENETSMDVLASQYQGIFIKGSSDINIAQLEAQALLVLQISLQAALDVILVAFDLDDNDDDVKELQSLIQSIKAAQRENQRIIIKDSFDVNIAQAQAQIDIVIQAAIQLLARLELKLFEI
ncbi:MAG: spore coat protein [Turicibacter sp.]|jgi:hypothetical protein|nr:spore coat protein [Turicibacter sp.]MEE1237535.1 spore coat protein [Turicibacter sp.]